MTKTTTTLFQPQYKTYTPNYATTTTNHNNNHNDQEYDDETLYYARPVIQWYSGHIAKAERLLQDTFFKAVDVVIEVRDARIVHATSHPSVPMWSSGKPRIVAITHIDTHQAHRGWKHSFQPHILDDKKDELQETSQSSTRK
jgi:ribosome biogenesis GTPase A